MGARAQGATDIWLFALSDSEVSMVARVTDRDGYDNQPSFSKDGRRLLFTSDRTGKADTHVYDLLTGTVTRVTHSVADKYSPTVIPGTGDRQFAVVHSDSVTMQGLWRYDIDGASPPRPIGSIDSVAYFAWMDASRVLLWRLSTPPTVLVLNAESDEKHIVAQDSAFSFKPHPSGNATSYLARWSGRHAEIRNTDNRSLETTVVAPILGDGRDFAWTPDGRLLMMDDSSLYAFHPGESPAWTLLADLGVAGGTRIAVSPDGTLIAVVGRH